MSLEIAWKQNILVTDSNLLKSLLVVFGFGSQVFICGFRRQNICSVKEYSFLRFVTQPKYSTMVSLLGNMILAASFISLFPLPSITIISWQSITIAIATVALVSWGIRCSYGFNQEQINYRTVYCMYRLSHVFTLKIIFTDCQLILFMEVLGQDF